ncbi:MAG TPA: C4-dicarboxylate transporter DctA [Steroidobacteraceae bacterium]|jgi:aerobic C4-dicarboxylate transport protein
MKARAPGMRKSRVPALHTQVLIGIMAGILVGYLAPQLAESLKVLGDLFIKSIKMIIGLVIFCTVVNGISGMGDMKKVGRVGGKALLYFEAMSTLALLFGAVVGGLLHPGTGFDVDPARLDSAAVASYAGAAHAQSAVKFLSDIIPRTLTGAFADGQILPVVFVSLLFGYVLSRLGERGRPLRALVDSLTHVIFGIINVLMRTAPIGAFGAMAYTVGRFGVSSLGPLLDLILIFAVMCVLFIVVAMGAVCRWAGINIFSFLRYLKEELLVTLGASSSDVAMPALMEKLQHLGCSQSVVGLVVPTGYVFNADGTSLYMVLAALFIAQAMNIHLTIMQDLALFGVSMLTSKGASGISGAGFIALVGTLSVVPAIPAAGMALLLGIDRIMSTLRAIVNITGNAVATVLMASLERELDRDCMARVLSGAVAETYAVGDVADISPACGRRE